MKLYMNKYPVKDSAKYVVDYVYDQPGSCNYYYQLVRIKDNAILYSNPDQTLVKMEAWKMGIKFDEVSFI